MSNYEARQAYQNKDTAEDYDRKRFTHLRGKIGDFLDKRTLSKALKKITADHTLKIIDFPCGTARITGYLIDTGHIVASSDISWHMMMQGTSKINNAAGFLGFIQCDASQICFKDDTFDCTVSIRFIGHIPKSSRQLMFKEFNRISKYLVVEASVKSRFVSYRRKIERRIGLKYSLPKTWDWEEFEFSSLREEFCDSNFRILGMWPKFRFLSDSWYILLEGDIT